MLSFREFLVENKNFETAEDIRKYVKTKYPTVVLDFYDSSNQLSSTLSMIKIPREQQKMGIGSEIMNIIVTYSDTYNKTILLSPEKQTSGPSKLKLEQWYKTFGFVFNKGKNKDYRFTGSMIRTPSIIR